jgi:small-conductance mechanosensitive channel
MLLAKLEGLDDWVIALIHAAIAASIAVGLAFVAHFVLFRVLRRLSRLSSVESDNVVVQKLREPTRWSLVAVAIELAGESNPLLARMWGAVDRFVVPALLGWVVLSLVRALTLAMERRAEQAEDVLAARSRRTRLAIFSRTVSFVIVFVTIALMLLSIPGVRNIGVTLMASASLVGLAVGAAAQPALKSLIAGIQMALTEPIRIDDHVVIEGEAGRVEDIQMTYVVIRTSDERRLIVPTSKFLEGTFQNWSRVGGGISGSVVLPVRPGSPITPIRAAYLRILAEHKEWDKRTGSLQVSEAKVDSVELKLVMSAASPSALANLRLAMREAMLEWIRVEMPEAVTQPEK